MQRLGTTPTNPHSAQWLFSWLNQGRKRAKTPKVLLSSLNQPKSNEQP